MIGMITSTVVRQHQRRRIGIIIIGNVGGVGAVGMIHVFATLIIIIVAADQVSDCLPLLTRLSPVELSPRWSINTLLVGMAETESQAAQATEHVQRPFQSAPALSGFVTVIRILGA
ncbi:hypothetical protein NKH36_29835 [Mesorhizobium sp. M1312]|uniref:hypothetical protein n=1 Tax=unclassified Mesorhizobium TaxID=325217 RepID=UPI003337AEA4